LGRTRLSAKHSSITPTCFTRPRTRRDAEIDRRTAAVTASTANSASGLVHNNYCLPLAFLQPPLLCFHHLRPPTVDSGMTATSTRHEYSNWASLDTFGCTIAPVHVLNGLRPRLERFHASKPCCTCQPGGPPTDCHTITAQVTFVNYRQPSSILSCCVIRRRCPGGTVVHVSSHMYQAGLPCNTKVTYMFNPKPHIPSNTKTLGHDAGRPPRGLAVT
jgi:hypothetical protein